VHATDDAKAERAAEIMRKHGAVDVEKRADQWRQTGWQPAMSAAAGTAPAAGRTATTAKGPAEQVLPVANEEMVVGKRQVQQGGVRVYARVTEMPVEETVRLHEERASVERRPVDRPVGATDDAFKEKTVEVRESVEEAVVSKRARVTEEVVVNKQATDRQETVRDTVRKTEVEVEKDAGTAAPAGRSGASRGTRATAGSQSTRGSYTGAERRRYTGTYSGVDRRAH
jgi:uncharacterized protein (TIGR02271 family)